jgi:hypothetical protein
VTTAREESSPQLPSEPSSARLDLLERDAELAAVDALISAAPGGGRLFVIEGPPGYRRARLRARARVLLRRGTAALRAVPRSPARGGANQAAHGAAALATPLFDPAQLAAEPGTDTSLATLHGLYWLTANVAARRPLLLAVDDLHWCDLPSLRWLAYLLPRMEGLGLLIVVGLRPAEPAEDPGLLGQIVGCPPRLALEILL